MTVPTTSCKCQKVMSLPTTSCQCRQRCGSADSVVSVPTTLCQCQKRHAIADIVMQLPTTSCQCQSRHNSSDIFNRCIVATHKTRLPQRQSSNKFAQSWTGNLGNPGQPNKHSFQSLVSVHRNLNSIAYQRWMTSFSIYLFLTI